LPKNKVEKGYLAIYSRLAKSAEKGAALNYRLSEKEFGQGYKEKSE